MQTPWTHGYSYLVTFLWQDSIPMLYFLLYSSSLKYRTWQIIGGVKLWWMYAYKLLVAVINNYWQFTFALRQILVRLKFGEVTTVRHICQYFTMYSIIISNDVLLTLSKTSSLPDAIINACDPIQNLADIKVGQARFTWAKHDLDYLDNPTGFQPCLSYTIFVFRMYMKYISCHFII